MRKLHAASFNRTDDDAREVIAASNPDGSYLLVTFNGTIALTNANDVGDWIVEDVDGVLTPTTPISLASATVLRLPVSGLTLESGRVYFTNRDPGGISGPNGFRETDGADYAAPASPPPPPPPSVTITGAAYDGGGTFFVTFDTQIAGVLDETYFQFYSDDAGDWVNFISVLDPGTGTMQLTGFENINEPTSFGGVWHLRIVTPTPAGKFAGGAILAAQDYLFGDFL